VTIVKSKYRGTREYDLVYRELVNAARVRGTFTYTEIMNAMGLRPVGGYMSRVTGQILAEISEDEVSYGRPMLSSIAVGVHGNIGEGFFKLARVLGKLSPGEDEAEFWEKERQAVYDCWKA
jgi:hypothetical protein